MPNTVLDSVWYLPSENSWRKLNLLAFRDSGRLSIGDGTLEFQGRKGQVTITGIRRVSIGKQGRDFINAWVKVEYGDPASPSTAYFADGSLLGWGGVFGGTRRLLRCLSQLAEGNPANRNTRGTR
jgi:hypothetical protein